MDNPEEKDSGYNSRKAIESLPDKALLLPDAGPQIPPDGQKAAGDSNPEQGQKPDDHSAAEEASAGS